MEIKDSKKVASDAELKAYLHPVRLKILGALTEEAQTMSKVARGLGVHPANLTHHFRALEDAKLIHLTERRDTGRNLEKLYRAAARHFEVEADEDERGGRNKLAMALLRRDLTAGARKLAPDDSDEIVTLLKRTRLPKRQFKHFKTRLADLIKEFAAADAAEGETYSLCLALYPGGADYGPTKRILVRKE